MQFDQTKQQTYDARESTVQRLEILHVKENISAV